MNKTAETIKSDESASQSNPKKQLETIVENENKVTVKIARVHPNDTEPFAYPERKTKQAAGYDIYAYLKYCTQRDNTDVGKPFTVTIHPGQTVIIPTDLIMEIPNGWEIEMWPRSGLSTKGISCHLGTIDADYHNPDNEIGIILTNNSNDDFTIEDNTRLAQLKLRKVQDINFQVISKEDLTKTDRKGGFGSTGMK